MKYYDFKKAKELIDNNLENIQSASLGMHEDWFWTAETVWEGSYKKDMDKNPEQLSEEFDKARKNGLSMFLEVQDDDGLPKITPAYKEMQKDSIGSLFGSDWATPTLQLVFKNGTDEMIPCYQGDGVEMGFGDKIEKQITWTSGVISSVVQENITPLTQNT